MILKSYALFDRKAGVFSLPMFFAHEVYLSRAMTALVSDLSTSVGQHPADFDLCALGSFDDQTGRFDPLGTVTTISSAVAFLPSRPSTGDMFGA